MNAQPASTLDRARRKLRWMVRALVDRAAARISPGTAVALYVDRPLKVCLPFIDSEQLEQQLAQCTSLRRLPERFGSVSLIFVTLATQTVPPALRPQIDRTSAIMRCAPGSHRRYPLELTPIRRYSAAEIE